MTFGERLSECMKQSGYSQKQLADKLNITPVRLNYWIKDKRQPDIPWIRLLANALNVSTDYLIGNTPDSPVEELSGKYNLSNLERDTIQTILELDDDQQKVLLAMAKALLKK